MNFKASEDTIQFRFASKRKSEQRRPDSKAHTSRRPHSQGSVGTAETNSTFGGHNIPGDFKTSQVTESVDDGKISFASDFPPYQQPTVCSGLFNI